jgi:hypothetical protein
MSLHQAASMSNWDPEAREKSSEFRPLSVCGHYRYHPRTGLALQLIGRTEYHGERFLMVCLPDGTRTHVPECMTHPESANPPLSWPPRLSLENLTALRIAVDTVLSLRTVVTTDQGGIDEDGADASRSIQRDRKPEGAAGREPCRSRSTAGEPALRSAADTQPITPLPRRRAKAASVVLGGRPGGRW